MKLRMLFDEKRRGEIRDAIKAGKPIEFRGKLPEVETPGRSMNEVEVLRQMIRDGERAQESYERLETIGKGQGAESIHSKLTQALVKAYGMTRYHVPIVGYGRLDIELSGSRIVAGMAKAAAQKNQKPKEVKPEESGKNQ